MRCMVIQIPVDPQPIMCQASSVILSDWRTMYGNGANPSPHLLAFRTLFMYSDFDTLAVSRKEDRVLDDSTRLNAAGQVWGSSKALMPRQGSISHSAFRVHTNLQRWTAQ